MDYHLPEPTTIASLPQAEQIAILDALFEPSPTIHILMQPVLTSQTFKSYAALIDACFAAIHRLASDATPENKATLHRILGSHPRLGAPKVDSKQSASEQAKLQSGSEETKQRLAALNAEYEARFPGLRYVVFVNGRGRPEIMEDMKARIARGNIELEEQEAIKAMCDIAKDRSNKLC
ncbi:putative allantoinase 1 [Ceratocystis fimbriata CBS 114723]|uniref:Putative allantoinase 1 n=1 Tax=Ceratocystis fimbriata CBS 114723 TaxID=1035309 RepID=A0A2C5WVN6_9PEZI|nr:putative allantoinase 1 [Ceratocystis fimbriata CBS 114723]